MAETFEELGIRAELIAGAEAAGWEAPSALQRDAVPVIRRGNNVVLHASPGAGTVGAYGLGVLDRVEPGDDDPAAPRVLVLASDADAASRTADALARLAAPAALGVRALAPGWPVRPAAILVASAADAGAGLRRSTLKLDRVEAFILDGADQIAAVGQWDDLETIIASVPSSAQRVVVTGKFDPAIEGFIERHVRKAMTVPPRAEAEGTPDTDTPLRYAVVSEQDRTAAAIGFLSLLDEGSAALICRTRDRAEQLTAELEARGVIASDGGDADGREVRIMVLPHAEADQRSTRAAVISFDVPMDHESLMALHAGGGATLVTPGELAHLRRIAARAGLPLKATPVEAPGPSGAAELVRNRLRATLRDTDLAADLALIEPLLVEHPAAEVAAAALHLARTRMEATPDRPGGAGRGAGTGAPAPSTSWVRLFVGAGSRDGLGPGDLVGAITGESALEGDQVGKIEIRESHSTVEVPTEAAERVIQALNGRSLRGRSLRVDFDRKDRAQKRPPGRQGKGPRPGGRGGAKRS